jgi:hypothetical protein
MRFIIPGKGDFGVGFEARVATGLAAFIKTYDASVSRPQALRMALSARWRLLARTIQTAQRACILDEAVASFRDLVKVNVLSTRAADVAAMTDEGRREAP